MHTTKDIAKRLGVNAQTVRRWSSQYDDHLTGERTGDSFTYTDDDFLLLWSVRRWRQLGYSLEDIRERLAQGERISEPPPEAPTSDEPPRALMIPESQFTAALAEIKRLEADRERLVIERDNALAKLDSERTAWLDDRNQVVSDLNGRINGLEREIGELRGKLAVVESERRPVMFWLIVLAVAIISSGALVLLLTRLGG
jgi:DNA-binding transcriptional MerR regulator